MAQRKRIFHTFIFTCFYYLLLLPGCTPISGAWIEGEPLFPNGQDVPDVDTACDHVIGRDVEFAIDYPLPFSPEFILEYSDSTGSLQWNSFAALPDDLSGKRWCSGLLISEDLFLTTASCVTPPQNWSLPAMINSPARMCENMHVDFMYQRERDTGEINLGDRYACSEVVEYQPGGLDAAILRLNGNPGRIYQPLEIETSYDAVDPIVMFHHPAGKPKLVSSGTIAENSTQERIYYRGLETDHGSTGAGIVNGEGNLIGIHARGGCNRLGEGDGRPEVSAWGISMQALGFASDTIGLLLGCGGRCSKVKVDTSSLNACKLDEDGRLICWGGNITREISSPAGTYKDVCNGSEFYCAIREDGTLDCRGENEHRQLNAPNGQYEEVACGGRFACAIASNGSLSCWGENNEGQTTAPRGSFSKLSAGSNHACAIRSDNGQVVCWGRGEDGQTNAAQGEFKEISCGETHTCGINANDSIICWGDQTDQRSEPPAGQFREVAVKEGVGCAIDRQRHVQCWGGLVQMGIFEAPEGEFIKIVGHGSASIVPFIAESVHMCGVNTNNEVVCWGDSNHSGVLTVPPARLDFIDGGGYGGCGITQDETLECWGSQALVAPRGEGFKSVDASGTAFACGIRSNDTLECWGYQDPDNVLNAPVGLFDKVACGDSHACAIRSNNKEVTCWGRNNAGQATPPAGLQFADISAGDAYTCGLAMNRGRSVGEIHCWGLRGNVLLNIPNGLFREIHSGEDHACAIRDEDGRTICWGTDRAGEVVRTPQDVLFIELSLGGNVSCGLEFDGVLNPFGGRVHCWGDNSNGVLNVPNLRFYDVGVHQYGACGTVAGERSVLCWGTNYESYLP